MLQHRVYYSLLTQGKSYRDVGEQLTRTPKESHTRSNVLQKDSKDTNWNFVNRKHTGKPPNITVLLSTFQNKENVTNSFSDQRIHTISRVSTMLTFEVIFLLHVRSDDSTIRKKNISGKHAKCIPYGFRVPTPRRWRVSKCRNREKTRYACFDLQKRA